MAGLVNFFSPWWKGVLGACSGPKWPPTAPLEHPEKVLSFKKEAERGWKSGARSLSWKSDWKPSISRSFCAIGTYCIFFRLEVTAVWKKKCRYKQISFTKSLLLLKGHFQSSFMFPFQCSITRVMCFHAQKPLETLKRRKSSFSLCNLGSRAQKTWEIPVR